MIKALQRDKWKIAVWLGVMLIVTMGIPWIMEKILLTALGPAVYVPLARVWNVVGGIATVLVFLWPIFAVTGLAQIAQYKKHWVLLLVSCIIGAVWSLVVAFLAPLIGVAFRTLLVKILPSAVWQYPISTVCILVAVAVLVTFIIWSPITVLGLEVFCLSIWKDQPWTKSLRQFGSHWGKFILLNLTVSMVWFVGLLFVTWLSELLGGKFPPIMATIVFFGGWLVCVYWIYAWVMSTSQTAKEMAQTPKEEFPQEVVKEFFNAVLAQNTEAIKASLSFEPKLAKCVWPDNGNTALHVAAWNGWNDIATLLLDADASICQVKNAAGKYPFELAREKGFDELAKRLEK